MNESSRVSPWGLRVIGAFKLATALLFLAVGIGIHRLVNKDLGQWLEHVVSLLRLDPENRMIHAVIVWVAKIDPRQLRALGVGTFFYAALELVEGVGLLLQRHWAEYLTIIATGSFIPLEGYELVEKVNPAKVAVLVLNVGTVIYLIIKLLQERRARAGRPEAVRALDPGGR